MDVKHAATRAAFGVAVDGALKYVNRDRDKSLLTLADLSERFLDMIIDEGCRFTRYFHYMPVGMMLQSIFAGSAALMRPAGKRPHSVCGSMAEANMPKVRNNR